MVCLYSGHQEWCACIQDIRSGVPVFRTSEVVCLYSGHQEWCACIQDIRSGVPVFRTSGVVCLYSGHQEWCASIQDIRSGVPLFRTPGRAVGRPLNSLSDSMLQTCAALFGERVFFFFLLIFEGRQIAKK